MYLSQTFGLCLLLILTCLAPCIISVEPGKRLAGRLVNVDRSGPQMSGYALAIFGERVKPNGQFDYIFYNFDLNPTYRFLPLSWSDKFYITCQITSFFGRNVTAGHHVEWEKYETLKNPEIFTSTGVSHNQPFKNSRQPVYNSTLKFSPSLLLNNHEVFCKARVGSNGNDRRRIRIEVHEICMFCYYHNGRLIDPRTPPSNAPALELTHFDPQMCTHLIYGFGKVGADRVTLKMAKQGDKDEYKDLQALKTKNPYLKVLLSVENYTDVDATRASEFATNAVAFLRANNFDGLDFFCKQKTFQDNHSSNLATILEHIYWTMRDRPRIPLLLTAGVSAITDNVTSYYDVGQLNRFVDYVIVHAYEMKADLPNLVYNHTRRSYWTSHNSAEPNFIDHLFPFKVNDTSDDRQTSQNGSLVAWSKAGIAKSRLIMGQALYAWKFVADQEEDNINYWHHTWTTSRFSEYCQYINGSDYSVVSSTTTTKHAKASRRKNNRNFVYNIYYDDENTLREKAKDIIAHGYGGAAIWALQYGDNQGTCGKGNYPLTKAMMEGLIGMGLN